VLHKTKGVVFRYVKFGESSIIVTIFTELFGLQSYIVNGVRGKSSRHAKIALFQPLTLLDLVVYHKESGAVTRIKEAKCYHPYLSLATDVRRSAIALFMNEVMNKAVKEQSHAQPIFDFISASLIHLDSSEHIENMHLDFLVGLSKCLGFGPHRADEIAIGQLITDEEKTTLEQLLAEDMHPHRITYLKRQNLLSVLLRFYALHIDHFGEMKSVAVLREVFS
jgi:DNA repair protein RecO (recombination protein O)